MVARDTPALTCETVTSPSFFSLCAAPSSLSSFCLPAICAKTVSRSSDEAARAPERVGANACGGAGRGQAAPGRDERGGEGGESGGVRGHLPSRMFSEELRGTRHHTFVQDLT